LPANSHMLHTSLQEPQRKFCVEKEFSGISYEKFTQQWAVVQAVVF